MHTPRAARPRPLAHRSTRTLRAALVLAVAMAVAPRGAAAQNSEVTRGLRLPFPAVSLGDDAAGTDINPGGLGFLRSMEAQFFATELSGGLGGSGQALYLATPSALGTWGFGFTHLGLQTRARAAPTPLAFADYARLSFSHAVALSQHLSFGLALHHTLADDPHARVTTLDLGAVWRPARWLSVGALVQDVTRPRLEPGSTGASGRLLDVNRAWLIGVGVRPGTDRLFLGADLRIEEITRRVDPTLRLLFEPLPGLALGGSVELRDRSGTTELTAQLGLTWALDFGGPRGQLSYASYVDRGRGHEGFTVGARLYRARERATPEPGNRWAKIRIRGGVPESQPPASLLGGGGAAWTTAAALGALEAARRDARVTGVLLAFDGAGFGLAQAEELRAAIGKLRAAKKRVVAHVEGASNAVYFAASAAERVYLHPLSTLNTIGFASQVIYLRGLADMVGVLPEFVAIGKYKSAPEQYTRKSSTEPAREARLAYLGDAMERFVAGIADGRKKTPDEVKALVARAPLSAKEAVAAGFADGLDYLDALPERLRKDLKQPVRFLGDPGAPAGGRWGGRDAIAVVHVEGTITDGTSGVDPILRGRNAGGDTIAAALLQAKDDPRVKAVVLRVNSPGGSVTASERIWRAVADVKKRKPVVASFGNVAASGGYYVSAGASEIFADPATLTGSIGVFFGKVSLAGLLAKGDVNVETLKTGPHADLLTTMRPWTDEERALVSRLVEDTYDRFLERVVEGRKLPRDQVHAVAQGRVWSGRAALAHKLVDRLGGLDEAIARAKELSGRRADEPMAVYQYPQPGLLARVLRRVGLGRVLGGDATTGTLARAARLVAPALLPVSPQLLPLEPGQPWAILPFEVDLR